MVTVLIKTDSHYTVDRKRIRFLIEKFLKEKGVQTEAEVSIAVVGNRKMKELNKKYRNIDKSTNILAFPLNMEKNPNVFVDAPDGVLRLGDIILSYPLVLEEAMKDNRLVDDTIDDLIIHGMHHLLGIEEE